MLFDPHNVWEAEMLLALLSYGWRHGAMYGLDTQNVVGWFY